MGRSLEEAVRWEREVVVEGNGDGEKMYILELIINLEQLKYFQREGGDLHPALRNVSFQPTPMEVWKYTPPFKDPDMAYKNAYLGSLYVSKINIPWSFKLFILGIKKEKVYFCELLIRKFLSNLI